MSTPQTQAVLDMEMHPKGEPQSLAPTQESTAVLFERLARDPAMDVDKLERLMQLHERATERWAKEQFNAAMSAAQKEMRPVAADADNPQTKSKYASYNALDRAVRPIYTAHGFGLSFNTGEGAPAEYVRVLCDVSHAGGFSKTYHVDMPADGKGARGGDVMTKTHAVGAAVSYGCRYLLKMIFNIAVGEDDRDGNAPFERPSANAPDGYDKWLTELALTAPNGLTALEAMFRNGPEHFRKHLTAHDSGRWMEIRDKARKGGKR